MTILPSSSPWLLERVVGPLISAVVLVAAVILMSRFFGPLPIAVNQTVAQRMTTFYVTGESEITTVPDQAEVSLGISSTESTVAAAQERANQVIATLTEQLVGLGIDKMDIRTENYSINPNYDFNEGSQRITGYQVNANLRVKVTDFSKLNQAIDAATAAGANQVGGIQFTLSDTKMDELKTTARKEAVADAKANAQELASISGIKLGAIVDIQESTGPDYMPMYRELSVAQGGSADLAAPTEIQPGSTTYQYTVTLSYQTL